MPGQRRCTAHPHIFEPDAIAPEGTFAIVACGPWCEEYLREHPPDSPGGDVNDLTVWTSESGDA